MGVFFNSDRQLAPRKSFFFVDSGSLVEEFNIFINRIGYTLLTFFISLDKRI